MSMVASDTWLHLRLEQSLGDTKRRPRSNFDRHQLPVFREIVDLMSIGAPAWLVPAAGRNLPLSIGNGNVCTFTWYLPVSFDV